MAAKSITVDGIEYAPVRYLNDKRVIIRSCDSGVHYGTLESRDGSEVTLSDSRRIWFWSGAASISEIAMNGVLKPQDCKFTVPVNTITVLGVCEVIRCTDEACRIIDEVPQWTMK